ncbi:MAG TPA: hypothetical protein VHN74_19400 [Candidatus Angelobacter sp.]|jgi:hypothetical protein|nr:hypothetical protein [Candidatus Angelobacter sp.]
MSTNSLQNVSPAQDVLSSWKEIACYLNRGVRTVQRWEAELQMPVRRPRGKTRSAVIAMRSELDAWLKACPVSARERVANAESVPGMLPNRNVTEQIVRCRHLRQQVDLTREEFQGSLKRLMRTLGGMLPAEPVNNRTETAKRA